MAQVISQATEPAASKPIGRVRVGKRDEGRTKSANLEMLNAARARRTRVSPRFLRWAAPLEPGEVPGRLERALLYLRSRPGELTREVDRLSCPIARDDVGVPALQRLNVMAGPGGEVVEVHPVSRHDQRGVEGHGDRGVSQIVEAHRGDALWQVGGFRGALARWSPDSGRPAFVVVHGPGHRGTVLPPQRPLCAERLKHESIVGLRSVARLERGAIGRSFRSAPSRIRTCGLLLRRQRPYVPKVPMAKQKACKQRKPR